MSDTPLYTLPDRGHFKVIRLTDQTGLYLNATCRIKEATVFNHLTDLRYSIVGYVIEFWPEGSPAPHEGGTPQNYVPLNRPGVHKLYMRTRSSITRNLLYLEDAIINDFLTAKVLADPMSLRSYSQEAKEQNAALQVWRKLGRTSFHYAEATHITVLTTSVDQPLAIHEEGMQFTWRDADIADDRGTLVTLVNYPFGSPRTCTDRILDHIRDNTV